MTHSPFTGSLSRRSLMGGALGLTVAGGAVLAGCSTEGSADAGAQGEQAELPSQIPFEGVKADIEPANEYSVAGYLKFPNPAITAVPEKPGDGSTITGLTTTSTGGTAPPMKRNQWWQNLNEQLGVTMELSWIKGDDYLSRFQTMVAGDDIPDVVAVPNVPQLDKMLKAKFTDLTEYLAGDAVAEYPMLANFPAVSWQEVIYGGSIYGIPRPLLPISSRLEARTDTLDELGIVPEFTSADGFLDLCREVTDRKSGRFAMVQPNASFLRSMFSLPNVWEKTDQGFRHEIESERYPEYLDFVAGMWSEKLFHPDAFNNPSLIPLFQQPGFVLFEVGGPGFTRAMPMYRPGAPTLTVKPVVVPLAEGGGNAPVRIGPGSTNMLGIRGDLDPDRVRQVLQVLNYTAAPFGTKEYLSVQYGKEGRNFTFDDDGQPIPNPETSNEMFPITLFPGNPNFMYAPEFPDVVRNECDYEATVGDNVRLNASTGLISETEISKSGQLDREITLAVGDIIQGRKPVSSWADTVATWRSKGGDQMRTEYEEADAAG
ncbi:MAG TPA: hypothetical protein IAA98_02890 [Candidatus Avipropionibacterium avicola]|uniref:Uncharacterized protein n=1 Tax=Candidatus Avipropionibacterium avicola TaxID=2840701 RepID=A0A9D1KMQ6_9ACTN|nr:hypothetical protein [Candidatus Avipropionibacterium avicola]